MSPDPYQPNPPKLQETPPSGATDLTSLMNAPGILAEPAGMPSGPKTDFTSLVGKKYGQVEYTPPRSATDWLIDGLTPFMIFLMVYSVIFFLLDVRYVYTEVHDGNLRWVAFCFVMGVVALNRLIARDGSDESILYMAALAGAIGFYTFSTTGMFEVGSVSRNFMNNSPYLATGFNMVIVVFIWWLVNRLTHECCVDENRVAGDVGILTGTARRMGQSMKRDPEVLKKKEERKKEKKERESSIIPMHTIEPFDPTEGYKPKNVQVIEVKPRASDRLSGRHPGMSIFYFSVPVMFLFAAGLRVVQQGGDRMVMAGKFYMGVYTVTAMTLLMLTSLGGLREYFRARKIAMPDHIGGFWMGLGLVMIAMVLVGALQLPMPSLPSIAYVDEHQTDYWSQGSKFELSRVSATPVEILEQSQFMDRVGKGVLALLGLFLLYAALKGTGVFAARIARRRDLYPAFVIRFFEGVEHFISRFTRLPQRRKRKPKIRIQRDIATSAAYKTSLGDPERAPAMSPDDHVEYAYEALCALAHDLGVPRGTDQTPYEFIDSFPKELRALKADAYDLTRLYVVAAYSPQELEERTEDQLRKFWTTYNRVRNRVVR